MTTEDRNIKLKHLITCMKCEASGKVCDENCPTQYEAGNMGEIIENLEAISEILKQQPCEDAISRQAVLDIIMPYCQDDDGSVENTGDLRNTLDDIESLPPVTPRSLNPEVDREESKVYCAECDHIEMCSWYPHDGCEWLKTDRYNAGYNAAKREIALSGEYERAYERGKADAQPKIGHWEYVIGNLHCSECNRTAGFEYNYCPNCGARMVNE